MATSEACGQLSAGLLSAARGSGFLPLVLLGSSINTLVTSGGQGSFFCFESTGNLSPPAAAFNRLGEPGLDEKFNMSSMSTLAGGTALIGTDIMALVRVSVANCWIV